jgi:AcrR family transcriptional regulator
MSDVTQLADSVSLPNPKQDRSRLSTSRLIQAAAELLVERGYEGMTLAAIGQRAGYSYGLVTQRFGSKEGLLWALVESMVIDWTGREAQAAHTDVWVRRMLAIVEGLRASAQRDPVSLRALWIVMFSAIKPGSGLNERVRDLHRNQRAGTARAIANEQEMGRLVPELDPSATAAVVVGALRGLAYQWLLDPDFDYDGALAALEHVIRLLSVNQQQVIRGDAGEVDLERP